MSDAGETAEDYVEEGGQAADRLHLECHDCGESWVFPNTRGGFKEMDDISARHVDDGHYTRTPCDRTLEKAIFPDGSEMRL